MKTVPTFSKRKFLGVRWVVANKFMLLLEFCWVSSYGEKIVQNLLLRGGFWLNYRYSWEVTIKLWLVVGGDGKIMARSGWSWVVGMKLWLVVAARGWWRQNYGWS